MIREIAQEAIDYQVGDRFFGDLTKIIERMYIDIDNRKFRNNIQLIDSGYGKEVEDLIRKRFNLNIMVDPDISFVAPLAIIPFASDTFNELTSTIPNLDDKTFKKLNQKLNPYNDSLIARAMNRYEDIVIERKAMAKMIDGKRGSINKRNATVSGYLAEVRHYMVFNVLFMKEAAGVSPRELAAATIHEIGHAFTGLEYHYRRVTTNVAISEVMSALNNNDIDKALYVYRYNFGKADLEESKLSKDSTRDDFAGAIAARFIKELESINSSNYYDATTFEYLSDNFATKMGAGKELATGLDKLNTRFNLAKNRNKHAALHDFLVTFTWFVIWASWGAGLIFGFVWFISTIFIGLAFVSRTPIYDSFKTRHTRILNEIANTLKNSRLPIEEKKALIEQYEVVKSVESINFDFKPYQEIIIGSLLPWVRKNNYYRKRQRVIEDSMNNGLFVAAAKMETI